MKHLATIQSEFLKEARKWDSLSEKQQRAYLKRHPKSKRRLTFKSKPKTNVIDDDDELDRFITDFSEKHNSAAEIWMSDTSKEKLKKLYDSKKYKFKSIIKDIEDVKDDYIEKMKDRGWKLFEDEDNIDQIEFIFYKAK